LVFLGGVAGASARGLIGELWSGLWSTSAINVIGTALLAALLLRNPQRRLRLTAGIGFLGSFTTFSAFAVDTLEATRVVGVANVVVTVGLGWLVVRLAVRR